MCSKLLHSTPGSFSLFVYGDPKPQRRPRTFKDKRTGRIVTANKDSDGANEWKARVSAALMRHWQDPVITGPVEVSIVYYMPRPARLCRVSDPEIPVIPTKRPDIDNLNKLVLDQISNAGVWGDDSQVYRLDATKLYGWKDHAKDGARITINWGRTLRHEIAE